nr:MAG TPA_asm: hypothetical protein [Bacteriophage sp.]
MDYISTKLNVFPKLFTFLIFFRNTFVKSL